MPTTQEEEEERLRVEAEEAARLEAERRKAEKAARREQLKKEGKLLTGGFYGSACVWWGWRVLGEREMSMPTHILGCCYIMRQHTNHLTLSVAAYQSRHFFHDLT
jgi:hypothetical protein